MKRIYSDNGQQSAPAWIVRTFMVIGFPLFLLWVIVSNIAEGFWDGARNAYSECRRAIVVDFRQQWNQTKPPHPQVRRPHKYGEYRSDR